MKNSMKILFKSMLLLSLAIGFFACDDDDSSDAPQTIVEIAAEDDRFTTLVSALQRTGLDMTLEGDGPFTVFAPTDDAFQASGIDLNSLTDTELSNVLLYHVFVGTAIMAADIQEGDTYATTANNTGPGNSQLSLYINKSGSAVKLNGAVDVVLTDIEGTNGVIHAINNVLLPLDIVGHAQANANLSTLVSTLTDADLVSTLQTPGEEFTVFAPTNQAFDDASDIVATLDTQEKLQGVLLYHVVSGNVRSSALSNGAVSTARSDNATVMVNVDSGVTVEDAQGNIRTVVLADIQGTNGVVHVINGVLVP